MSKPSQLHDSFIASLPPHTSVDQPLAYTTTFSELRLSTCLKYCLLSSTLDPHRALLLEAAIPTYSKEIKSVTSPLALSLAKNADHQACHQCRKRKLVCPCFDAWLVQNTETSVEMVMCYPRSLMPTTSSNPPGTVTPTNHVQLV